MIMIVIKSQVLHGQTLALFLTIVSYYKSLA